MTGEFTKAQLQDLSSALNLHRHRDVNQMVERFELEELAAEIGLNGTTSDKIYDLLKNMEGHQRREVLQYLIDTHSPLRIDKKEEVEEVLSGSDWELSSDERGDLILQKSNNNGTDGPAKDAVQAKANVQSGLDSSSGTNSDTGWDVFICHAGEDKDSIARPLANELEKLDMGVWYDEFELELGDDLPKSIDDGLRRTDFGVVILSEHFFGKHWTERELKGLFAREEEEDKVILPLWYNIGKREIREYSPPLANKYALKIDEDNVSEVAKEIRDTIRG